MSDSSSEKKLLDEKNIPILISKLETKFSEQSEKSYLLSYDAIVEYFNDENHFVPQKILAGIFMVYGWMPTIPDFFKYPETVIKFQKKSYPSYSLIDLPEVVLAIKKIDENTESDKIELLIERLKPIINNSLVGTSKFLHFVNPEEFPIWDSKIAAGNTI